MSGALAALGAGALEGGEAGSLGGPVGIAVGVVGALLVVGGIEVWKAYRDSRKTLKPADATKECTQCTMAQTNADKEKNAPSMDNSGSIGEAGAPELPEGEDEKKDKKKIKIEPKIKKQMGKRGWTEESIKETIENPDKTIKIRDTRYNKDGTKRDDPATGYQNKDGSYVVVNDSDNTVVQVSKRNDPTWRAPW